ncbi:MAG: response regulator [Proteobacteria bacterium]|jgi:two-component system response regulator RegA|nr:response regulator [Pseudomonadota bacterium]
MSAREAILVVEDDPALKDTWVAVFEQHGYCVVAAGDAVEALALARTDPRPSLALLDLGLPPRPGDPTVGLELLQQLLLELPNLKVVVLTGQDEPAVCWRAIGLGAFDFLVKPASRAQVIGALQRACMFLESERQLALSGQARITVTGPVAEGVREFGDAAQERLVRSVMADANYNVAQAARQLGLSREHMYYFIRKFGIERQAP